VALIAADRLDDHLRLERERIHLLLIDDARRGLEDIVLGRTHDADQAWRPFRNVAPLRNQQPSQ
jgi:hypothetical protein